FGDKSLLPTCARREYTLQAPGSRSPAWQKALATAASTRLGDVARAFEQLTRDLGQPQTPTPEAASAWYNLAVARAWLGDNRAALEAVDRYVEMETDEGRAVTACALAEVLRMGQGLEEDSDYRDYSVTY